MATKRTATTATATTTTATVTATTATNQCLCDCLICLGRVVSAQCEPWWRTTHANGRNEPTGKSTVRPAECERPLQHEIHE